MAIHLNEILKLSLSERLLIMEALWNSIVSDQSKYEISEEHRLILEEALEEYKKNPNDVKSWEEVKAELLRKK
jgi:putative addiction module component (TIGR02574 family)